MKTCLFFTSDLMFSSRVKPVANQSGYDLRFPGFQESSWDPPPELILLDLEFVSAADLDGILEKVNASGSRRPKTVAYAPHVKENLLEQARSCGVDLVWSRGQFNKGFSSLFE